MTDESQKLPLEFELRLAAAQARASAARLTGDKLTLANALKELGNIERRPPFMQEAANRTFREAAELYRELEMPLEAAWVIRHIGINHEYAERLTDAEASYDESLELFRRHANDDSLDYANTVRYPAVIKNRLGKREESARLWEEAHDRYREIGPNGLGEGVAEAAAWLTIFAIEKGDPELAQKWFKRASEASAASADPDTHKFVAKVTDRLKEFEGQSSAGTKEDE
jgi:tetratricopeptide (TPR) repeat protein